MMNGIGKVLRFQAHAGVLWVGAANPLDAAVKKISGIKLNARLRSVNLQYAGGLNLVQAGGEVERIGTLA